MKQRDWEIGFVVKLEKQARNFKKQDLWWGGTNLITWRWVQIHRRQKIQAPMLSSSWVLVERENYSVVATVNELE